MKDTLSLANLSKTYPCSNVRVLQNISLSVKKREFIALLGPSGCGKSTLLSILAGVEQQTTGKIELHGEAVANRAGMFGYMPQQPTLLPWETVLENVTLGLKVRGVGEKERKEKALELLTHFKLQEYAGMYPNMLSGGMAQRVALLRTILFNPQLLLLDEPFGALDALTRFSCQQWLLRVWEEYQSTVIFVTHDIREALFLSDRIYVMSARPGTLIANIPVPLPRPRKKEHLLLKKATDIEKKLLDLLVQDSL